MAKQQAGQATRVGKQGAELGQKTESTETQIMKSPSRGIAKRTWDVLVVAFNLDAPWLSFIIAAIPFAVVLLLWQLLGADTGPRSVFLPPPTAAIRALWD